MEEGVELGSERWQEKIREGAAALGVTLAPAQTALFARHARELMAWNRRMNLTAITDPDEIAEKHFVDSVVPAAFAGSPGRMLDIGSGGGFPGIPLKVCLPSTGVTLIDASRKRVHFLMHVLRLIRMEGIAARHIRAEELAGLRPAVPGFDLIVSRAVSGVKPLFDLAFPLLGENGMVMAMQGHVDPAEIEEVRRYAGRVGRSVTIHKYRLPFSYARRTLVMLGPGDAGGRRRVS